jgi:hypothetical protein
VAAFVLIFIFFVERLRVYDDVAARPRVEARPSYDPSTTRRLQPRVLAVPGRFTAAALAGGMVAFLFLPVRGPEDVPAPARAARSVEGIRVDRGAGQTHALTFAAAGAQDVLRDGGVRVTVGEGRVWPPGDTTASRLLLMIDGNRNGNLVLFDHQAHEERLGGDRSCATCHHLSLPLDRNTSCAACHRDMYDSTQVFDHDVHVTALDGDEPNSGCAECHRDPAAVKSFETATACTSCHRDPVAGDPVLSAPQDRWRPAPGYTEAMHGLCVECHKREVQRHPEEVPSNLAECRTCHDPDRRSQLRLLEPSRSEELPGRVAVGAGAGGEEGP